MFHSKSHEKIRVKIIYSFICKLQFFIEMCTCCKDIFGDLRDLLIKIDKIL